MVSGSNNVLDCFQIYCQLALIMQISQIYPFLNWNTYEVESKKAGKASFAYAWVLDETGEERER